MECSSVQNPAILAADSGYAKQTRVYYMIKCTLDQMGAINKITKSNDIREVIVFHCLC